MKRNSKLKEKIAYCSGKDFWHTKELDDAPSVMMTDGPHGLRRQAGDADMLGLNESVPATCFPTAVSSACSWDPELLAEVGKAINEESLANGVSLLLGPGVNIKRDPLCGRNFEYFSEDPFLAGKLAAGFIRGGESTGAGTCIKHFALNNQEYKRFSSNSIADERTMREIYLSAFEIAVKEGHPSAVMCSYNKINGVHCSDDKKLLTDILRDEWGFDGLVVTDWGAMSDRTEGYRAGCDLVMPGGSAYMEKDVLKTVEAGELDESLIDVSAGRIRKLALRGSEAVRNAHNADMLSHYVLAKKTALESAVLLKNDNGILPISGESKVVFIGHMAKEIRYQGAGSSRIKPYMLRSALDVRPGIPFFEGTDIHGNTSEDMLHEAECAAKEADTAVLFLGLTDRYESEGFDRKDMRLPDGHIQLAQRVIKANPRTVIVLHTGSAVELPFADDAAAILYMGLSGEAGGDATISLLFGDSVPCGKLAESWPYRYEDVITSSYYSGNKDAQYRESIYVGYRYYGSAGKTVRFPFGYGLSYSSFRYSDISVDGDTVSCIVENTGKLKAKETVQLYVSPPEGGIFRAKKELKGFTKIELMPGERKQVTFPLDNSCFRVWNDGWKVPAGTYTILIGPDSVTHPLSIQIDVTGEKIVSPADTPEWYKTLEGVPSKEDLEALIGHEIKEDIPEKGHFTMENTIMEMKDHSLIMRLMYRILVLVLGTGVAGSKDKDNPQFLMALSSAADSSLSSMKINGGMNNSVLEGMLEMANGRPLRGLAKMIFG